MIDPDVGGTENGDGITITPRSLSNVVVRVSDQATLLRHDVLHANPVDDNVVHELHGEATTVPDLNIGATTIDGLVGGNHQLLLQTDDHAAFEGDPKRTLLSHSITEGSWFGVNHILIGVISDDIDGSTEASDGASSEPFSAFG